PDVVKVVTDINGFALYFSRSPLPYNRTGSKVKYYKHVGLYAYRKAFLLKFAAMERTMLEKAESLEQLRVIENGYRIKVVKQNTTPLALIPRRIWNGSIGYWKR